MQELTLTTRTIEDNDKALLASFSAHLIKKLGEKAIYDSEFEGLQRYEDLPPPIKPEGTAIYEAARNALDTVLVPAGADVVIKLLARLKLSTDSRSLDAVDIEAQLVVYGDELQQYPIDVVTEACEKWARREQWWPAVSLIVSNVSAYVISAPRFLLLMKVERLFTIRACVSENVKPEATTMLTVTSMNTRAADLTNRSRPGIALASPSRESWTSLSKPLKS